MEGQVVIYDDAKVTELRQQVSGALVCIQKKIFKFPEQCQL